MRHPHVRLMPLSFALLFFFNFFFLALLSFPSGVHAHDDIPTAYTDPAQEPISEKHITNQGDDAFRAAMEALNKVRHSSSSFSRLTKPTGMIGTTAYYVKELFFLLFMNGPPDHDLLSPDTPPKKLSQPLASAVALLEEAAQVGNQDAIFTLAEMNFYGNYSYPRNYSEAFRRYKQLPSNSSAQHMVGFMYATGLGGAVVQDQAKAMTWHTFAAKGGDIRSQMTIAYRHHSGIGAPRDCEQAVYYYKKVADRAMAWLKSGPPGGHAVSKQSFRIADDEGGVYGEGASVSSSGPNAKVGGPNSDAHASFDDVMEYLDLMSRKGDLKATFSLAKLHYDGGRALKRDLPVARKFFLQVARSVFSKDGKIRSDHPHGAEKLAAKAAGYLGRMWLRGEGLNQNFDVAKTWFLRGIEFGDALSQYSMGVMYLEGLSVPRDPVKAAELFGAAADQDLPMAQVALGELFLDQGDVATAFRYFDLAARNGRLEAYYYLAELSHQGVGRDRSCGMAVAYYKIVAEKAECITASFAEANEAYENGDLETALVYNMMAAEQGFEYAQANVAYLLDQTRPKVRLDAIVPLSKRKPLHIGDAALALIYWTRSAKQLNIDSMVKMGDYYLDGLGTRPDAEKAAACYQAAAETMQSAQAFWNLGWMHENGVGLDQDFHLAKRFYDHALETNPREAYLPVTLALYKLRLRSWWNQITHGDVNSIQEEPETKTPRSLSEWLTHFLEAGAAAWADEYGYGYDEDEAADEAGYMRRGDDFATAEHGAAGDDYYDDLDASVLETLMLVVLAACLAALVWYRNQRVARAEEERRRQQQQRDGGAGGAGGGVGGAAGQQQQQQGLFPDPGNPEFMAWAAGGIGH